MYNYKLTIQYDGTRYRGWQVQGNTPQTIQGKLEAVLSRLAGEPVELHGSGRTDAGVPRPEPGCQCQTVSAGGPSRLSPSAQPLPA